MNYNKRMKNEIPTSISIEFQIYLILFNQRDWLKSPVISGFQINYNLFSNLQLNTSLEGGTRK